MAPVRRQLTFSAAGTTDPDGNQLAYRWFFYWEAGTFGGEWPKLDGSATETVNFTVPPVVQPSTLHLILEVLDDGTPRLRSYRRMIVTVNPK